MSNIYLSDIVNLHEPSPSDGYPFNIPAIKSLRSLSFTTDVTYFIGENGSGKSTLLEAIAIKMGMNARAVDGISISALMRPIQTWRKN